MALRRSIGSLSTLLRSLALPEARSAAQQPCSTSTLSSLRSLWAGPAPTAACSPAAAAAAGNRHFAAAAGGAAPPAPAAAAGQAAAAEESLEEIRARIFGTHIGNGLRSGRKVLRRALVGQRVAAYYPQDPVKADPLMISVKAETAKLKLDRLRRRGKAPPKKGAGKRAGKKK